MNEQMLWLGAITFLAATVNGALGYGFSSITVPLALLFLSNRVLNPALILIEVPLNAYVLWVNRGSLPAVWRRMTPVVVGLIPGILAGTALITSLRPDWLKFYTYAALLPLILLQASGFRRPVRAERYAGLAFGASVGALYSVTTISGPPLAMALSNQGLEKREFRAALGAVRLAESSMTAIAYASAGLFTASSVSLVPWIVPAVALGVPLGARVITRMRPETFRRVCMSFDAWIVAFGMSKLSQDLGLVPTGAAYFLTLAVVVVDAWLLYRFFSTGATRELDDGSSGIGRGARYIAVDAVQTE